MRETMGPSAPAPKLLDEVRRTLRVRHRRPRTRGTPRLVDRDLAEHLGAVALPDALERKLPSASRDFAWQWLFPASRTYVDRETGEVRRHHIHPTVGAWPPAVKGDRRLGYGRGPAAEPGAVSPTMRAHAGTPHDYFCEYQTFSHEA